MFLMTYFIKGHEPWESHHKGVFEMDVNKPEERKDYRIIDSSVKLISEEQKFLVGCLPGTAITGFIDVEKFLAFDKHTFFLEKKLPFQILIIASESSPIK